MEYHIACTQVEENDVITPARRVTRSSNKYENVYTWKYKNKLKKKKKIPKKKKKRNSPKKWTVRRICNGRIAVGNQIEKKCAPRVFRLVGRIIKKKLLLIYSSRSFQSVKFIHACCFFFLFFSVSWHELLNIEVLLFISLHSQKSFAYSRNFVARCDIFRFLLQIHFSAFLRFNIFVTNDSRSWISWKKFSRVQNSECSLNYETFVFSTGDWPRNKLKIVALPAPNLEISKIEKWWVYHISFCSSVKHAFALLSSSNQMCRQKKKKTCEGRGSPRDRMLYCGGRVSSCPGKPMQVLFPFYTTLPATERVTGKWYSERDSRDGKREKTNK